MADIGLGGHKGDRHAIANLALAQIGVGEKRELIGRAETRGALDGADDDRAGVGAKRAPSLGGLCRMLDMAIDILLRSGPRPSISSNTSAGRW
jgi:hypothetical protein